MRTRSLAVCTLAVLAVMLLSGFQTASAVGCGGGGGLFARIAQNIASRVEARQEARAARIESRQAARVERLGAAGSASSAGCAACSAGGVQFTQVTRTTDAAGKCVLCGTACECVNCACDAAASSAKSAPVAASSSPAPKVKSFRTETYLEKVCTTDRLGRPTCVLVSRTRIVEE